MKRVLIVAIVVAAILLVAASTYTGYFMGSDGFRGTTITGNEIVFASDLYSDYNELYLMNDDGTDVRRLTYNTFEDNNPAFSYDKRKIVFHRAMNSSDVMSYEIFTLDLETGKETRLTNNNYLDGHPDWSPDGRKVVFTRYVTNADLYVVDLASGQETQLTNTSYDENDAEWSPDGSRIAFKSTEQSENEEIYVMDSDGSNARRLTQVSGWQSDHDPSWSSDSGHIYFERYEGNASWELMQNTYYFLANWDQFIPWDLYSVDLDGRVNKITSCTYICWLPVSYNNSLLFLKDDFGLLNSTLITLKVDYAKIMPDGSGEEKLLKEDEFAYKKSYFDF
jgi:Tol biopolymer transport system component